MKAKHKVWILAMLVALTHVNCKKDSANPATAQSQLVGTWNPQSATVNGTATPVSQAMSWVAGAVAARLVINSNGSFSYTELDGANTVLYSNGGTYTTSGSSATLTYTTENGQPINPPVTQSLTWTVSGSQLTTTTSVSGNTVVIVYAKV